MVWLITVQVLLWTSLVWRAGQFGWFDYSLMAVFAVVQLVTVYPLLLRPDPEGSRADPMAFRRRFPDTSPDERDSS